MSKIELTELIQRDIEDLKSVFNYEEYGLTKNQAQLLAKASFANLEEHLEELIKECIN
jgi:hypothetical protein